MALCDVTDTELTEKFWKLLFLHFCLLEVDKERLQGMQKFPPLTGLANT